MGSKYTIIARELERQLPQMLLSGSTRLPSEPELCSRFRCSRQTIRSALKLLQDKQLIIKYKGSGTYISSTASKGSVAMLLPRSSEYIYAAMSHTAKRFFSELNLSFTLYDTDNRILREREILTELLNAPPAGILVYPSGTAMTCVNADILRKLSDAGVPVVYLNTINSLPDSILTVSADICEGSRLMALRLMADNKRKLKALLSVSSAASAGQFSGLMKAAVECTVDFDESDILWLSDTSIEELRSGRYGKMLELIKNSIPRGSSVFCGNDEIAYFIVRLLKRCGLSVPDDVMVSGFDNSYLCTMVSPSLTSVGPLGDEPVSTACRVLLNSITGRGAESVNIPMEITERDSTRRQ